LFGTAFRWATEEELIAPEILYGLSRELISPEICHALKKVEGLRKGKSTARESAPVQPAKDEDVQKVLPHRPTPIQGSVKNGRQA
jgi:hypothetical protein